MKANTDKLLCGWFKLDGLDRTIRGYYNPYENWNGAMRVYILPADFVRFCQFMGWKAQINKHWDSIIIDTTDDYEELPIVTRKNTRWGWMTVIDFSGWMWLRTNEYGTLDNDDMIAQIESDRLVYNRFNHW